MKSSVLGYNLDISAFQNLNSLPSIIGHQQQQDHPRWFSQFRPWCPSTPQPCHAARHLQQRTIQAGFSLVWISSKPGIYRFPPNRFSRNSLPIKIAAEPLSSHSVSPQACKTPTKAHHWQNRCRRKTNSQKGFKFWIIHLFSWMQKMTLPGIYTIRPDLVQINS